MLLKYYGAKQAPKPVGFNSEPTALEWFLSPSEIKQEFNFSDGESEPDANIFTVIIGKNGTGKSRLMKSVIEKIAGKINMPNGVGMSFRVPDLDILSNTEEIELLHPPENVIAVSTSPFDKFPLEAVSSQYTYLGLRNLESTDLGMEYMTKIFTSLLKSFREDKSRAAKVSKVLAYLGYTADFKAIYELALSKTKIRSSLNSLDPVATFSEFYLSEYWTARNDKLEFLLNLDEHSRRRQIEKILEICGTKINSFSNRRFEALLTGDGLSSPEGIFDRYNIDDLIFLADMKLVKLQEIILKKEDSRRGFSIGDASSGEQSIVLSILGIASQISDNSLVCIDEPEVCLHPQWQEKYIELLIKTFKGFKGCHFLIATHSPLIVSRLADENCYLMKMEDGKVIPASQVNNKSVDFQLANNFGAPGFKNEYLTRELISILTMFGETGTVGDEAKEKLEKLLTLKEGISDADPVKKLMEMAQEALKESL